jgi:hypothetical protein
MRFYINPVSEGLTYVSKAGVATHAAPGTFLDTEPPETSPLPPSWQPPPDAFTLLPCDTAAQTALQASIDAKRTALTAAGYSGSIPGLAAGLPTSVPIWTPNQT